ASLSTYVAAVLAIGVAWTALRLAIGLLLIHGIRRRSSPCHDREVTTLVRQLGHDLGMTYAVDIALSREIGTAAVIGTLRPTVLVSDECRLWLREDLRAVIAHELAHVVRRDAGWRFIATMARMLHFYNPLLQWLGQQFLLAQELAADQLAMTVAGAP